MSGGVAWWSPGCDAHGCDRPADWAYIGEGGDIYLCDFHGGNEPVKGWVHIDRGDGSTP